jgi:hypothetical protein
VVMKLHSAFVVLAFLAAACRAQSPKTDNRRLLPQLDSPVLLRGDNRTAYRDPAVLYHEKTFYLFPTIIKRDDDDRIYLYTGVSRSRDLKTWSQPTLITPKDQRLTVCGIFAVD